MSQNEVKIQINSLAALERLIGGDSQLEFEIRNSVADNFASKYFKSVVDVKLRKALDDKVTKEVKEHFKNPLWPSEVRLSGKGKEAIDDYVKDLVKKGVIAQVKDSFIIEEVNKATRDLVDNFKDQISSKVEVVFEEVLKAELQQRIQQVFSGVTSRC